MVFEILGSQGRFLAVYLAVYLDTFALKGLNVRLVDSLNERSSAIQYNFDVGLHMFFIACQSLCMST